MANLDSGSSFRTQQQTEQSKPAQLAAELHPAANQGEQRTEDAPQTQKAEIDVRIQNALKGLVRAYDLESEVIRRHHVRRFLEAEEFWKGNQHLIWSERQFRWQTPFEWATENKRDDTTIPRYQYVTNIYRALGLSIIAAISQRLPKVRFQPKSTKNEIDIATARAASDVVDVVERNNQLDLLSVRCAYLLYTQGLLGAHVRYVMDKQFGTQQIPQVEMQPVQIHNGIYLCRQCGAETPAEQMNAGGGLMPEQQMSCPQCDAPIGDGDYFPPEMGEGPVVTKIQEFPQGQEVISIYGGLNLKMMPTAETKEETNYLILVREKHLADVRAAHPLKSAMIGSGPSGAPADNNYERYARLSLFDSSPNYRNAQPFSKHVTYMDAWLRPRAFYYEDDEELRTELLKEFPNGVHVIMAGDEFLDAIPENLDDYWEICRPMPGYGMYVDGVGADGIPLQKRLNDASNIQAEHVEFASAPPVLVDGRYVNVEALRNKRMRPGQYTPVAVNKDTPARIGLADLHDQIEIKLDPTVASGEYGNNLISLAQMITGSLPSIFGGNSPDAGKTASEYAMSRVQSLGKLNLFWRSVMMFWARLEMLSVECFRRNRTQDYEHVVTDKSGNYLSKFVRLENLKGNITAHPEADQDFPAAWAEIRSNVLEMLKVAPTETLALLMHAANAPLLKKVLANPEMVIPGEDDREKQFREIQEMLESPTGPVPMMAPAVGGIDPQSGGPVPAQDAAGQPIMQPTGQFQSTIEAEPFVDNHVAHIQTIQEWAVSDDGITAKAMKPMGYANVMLHLMSHLEKQAYEKAELLKIQAQQAMMAGIPPEAMMADQGGGQPPSGKDDHKSGQKAPRGTQGKSSKEQDGGMNAGASSMFPGATGAVNQTSSLPM